MEIEVISVECSSNGQHYSGQANIISQPSDRPNASRGNKILQKPNDIPKSRNQSDLHIESSKMGFLGFLVFTSVVITVGVLTVCLTSPKPSETCQLTVRRTMKSSLISSSQPRFVTVADLNNDHQMDLVVANSGTNTIGIFLSNGDGTFSDQQTYSTGNGSLPYSIVVSDFNSDTYLDIGVATYGTNSIGIFLGNGNGPGTFNDQKIFPLGPSRPFFITSGDFNKDNRMDLVVANHGTNNIGIFFGYGNGSFQNQLTYSTGYDSLPYSLAVGDFNNDTELDIAVANHGTSNIGIFLGYGNGTFASQITYTTTVNFHPSSIAVGDLNNDNRLDIVISSYGTGNIGIFFGHGNGTFRMQRTYIIGSRSYSQYVTVGDLNKDNELDIVIVDSQNDQIHILPGYGNGSFPITTTYDGIPGSSPFCIAVADFNNNNQSDIVVANYGTDDVLILTDYFIKSSTRQTNYDVGKPSSVSSVTVSDFNNDHILDIVCSVDDSIVILIGSGNGIFGLKATYSVGNRSGLQYIDVGDLNNDNTTDIVTADRFSDGVSVFLGDGDGTFSLMQTYSTSIGSQPWWIVLGDVNNDDQLDIISANTGTNSIGILLGHGNGTFATVMTYFIGDDSKPYAVAVGDINNDNHLDLVVAGGDGVVTIFRGFGNGTFIIWNTYSIDSNSYLFSVALANFNSDHHLDIAVANTLADNVGVFLGYGNGTFTVQTPYSTGSASQPHYVIVADFDLDNISDIATSNFGNNEIAILHGYGNGSFVLAVTYSTGFGSNPYGLVAADLNNNQQLEIVVALWGMGDIAILTEYNAAAFDSESKYFTGSAPHPFSVAVGDFNHDNRSDIVAANSGTGNLAILLGSGNGTFGIEMMYPIGTDSYPQYVITCDINNDTNLDIVSVNSKSNSISIIMGYGNGIFAEQLIYSTGDGSYPYAVASGYINNDTRLDLVIANSGTGSIGIFFGFDYTSFHSQITYLSNDSLGSSGIAVEHFNNDSFLDIAVTFYSSDTIGILLGYGNGSFSTLTTYSTGNGSNPYGIDVGDFNNDNRSDIVVTNLGTDNIGVLLGDGNGSFAAIMTYSTGNGSSPIAAAVSDLNNDGRLDIVVANFGTDNVGVFLGYGNGNFSVIRTYPTGQGSSPRAVTVNDFNNDHLLDIAVANSNAGTVGILLGYGNGTFKDQIAPPTGVDPLPYWIIAGDFNSDNQLDIATAVLNYNGIGIFLGYGNGSFAGIKLYWTGAGSQPVYISVGDLNNDNILDIAVVNYRTDTIVVLFGFGDGTFLLGTSISTGTRFQRSVLTIGDFNNDSRLDIAVASYLENNIKVFLNNGSQPFANMTTFTIGDRLQPHSVAVGDLNHDGWSDIVVANYGTDSVGVLLGYGDGTFDPMITYATGNGSAPYSIAVADFNNDTALDIVVTNSKTDNIAVLIGYGNGTFVIGITYSTGTSSRPYTVAIGDFNNDNRSDIAIANSGTSNIFLLYGYGNGTFGNGTSYSLGYGYHPYSVAVIDLNQDNSMDIAIACYDTDHIETLMQMC